VNKKLLATLLELYGWSPQTLGRVLGVAVSTVYRWVEGKEPEGLNRTVLEVLLVAGQQRTAEQRRELGKQLELGLGAFLAGSIDRRVERRK
jgi:transposase